ncbi:GGDEF domain-containing protein [Sphingomonas immobilis]|uniref:diguanylate cyclase n=1 Tax=Sphingomonas immobilis TaxID=3063997 RepID=A0ABT8ZWJ2_9SPHN|nr:GGDEF domain-containing protein [Sphingomonas sp. CA1-15]MDO7841638.1 GGDEF domain-containing protein [Sphingomonas sp. CA1-15]
MALFDGIRDFLIDQRLSPDPKHYHFAYRVLTETDGVLARSVRALTDGGFRLSSRDIELLGGEVGAVAPQLPETAPGTANVVRTPDAAPDPMVAAQGLVARTQHQVEGFSDMVHAMRAETQDFGRDLAASADAIRGSRDMSSVEEVVRLTSVMLTRVHSAESKLEVATNEASELRAKLEEARDNARRDPLTELANRRAFEEAFAAVQEQPVHVAICDVDRFKSVNDRFGHGVGDRVLKAIGGALSESCAGHLVARYGGEEFAVLFSGVDQDVAYATLEDARAVVAAKHYRVRESKEPIGSITFSAGLTTASPGETLPTVFARADRLLYAAKNAGRDTLRAD